MNSKFQKSFFYRHIAIVGVLCFFIATMQAQVRPKQLRNEILQSQNPTQKSISNKAKNKKVRQQAQSINPMTPLAPIVNPLNKANATIIYMDNANVVIADEEMHPDMQILKGNVRFRHDNAILYCDSAYFYQKANSLDAFSNVRIVQGDTLFVYGDFLYYDGNMRMARLRHNVRMENRKTTLTTDSLNYDRNSNLAYYYTGGKIVDPENILTSVWGQYSTTSNDALFKTQVKLTNKNFTMDSDTMKYNTRSSIANIVGPTHILYQNETDIYSKKGWYNTAKEQMMLLDRSKVAHKDGKTIVGDTIFYDKISKYGESFVNVEMVDSVKKNTLYGDYVYYNENTETGIASDSALLVDWSGKDTLWVHADTLHTFKDSIYDVAKGFLNVRIYRNDIQGLCDSLTYTSRDSVMNMYGEPVLWAEKNQLSGEFIQAFTKNQKVEKIHIQRNAIAIQKEDSLYFNQLSGKEIIAHIDSGALKKVDINGNAETIYFPRDDSDSTLIGINKTESSFVVMHMKNKKVERIVLTTATTGVMYPLLQLSGGDLFLKNFFWLDEQRPKKSSDVLLTFEKKPREKIGTSSLMGKNSESDDGKSGQSKTKSDNKNGTERNSSGSRTTNSQTNSSNSLKGLQQLSR